MIYLERNIDVDDEVQHDAIFFTWDETKKMIMWLERSANTLSPPDMELIKLIDDLKGANMNDPLP